MRLMHAAVGATMCSLLAVSSPTEAAVITYTYVGQPLHATETGTGEPDVIDGYSGQMVFDEAALGHSLKNAVVSFGWSHLDQAPPDGLVAFDIFPVDEGHGIFFDWIITFTTNESRQIIDWNGYFLNGPPDGGITTGFDFWYNAHIVPPSIEGDFPAGMANYFSEGPGTWTVEVSPVPIPGALALFLTGIAGLGVFGWVRRRIAEPCMSG